MYSFQCIEQDRRVKLIKINIHIKMSKKDSRKKKSKESRIKETIKIN